MILQLSKMKVTNPSPIVKAIFMRIVL